MTKGTSGEALRHSPSFLLQKSFFIASEKSEKRISPFVIRLCHDLMPVSYCTFASVILASKIRIGQTKVSEIRDEVALRLSDGGRKKAKLFVISTKIALKFSLLWP